MLLTAPGVQAAGDYEGTVYQDYNGNGTRDLTNTVATIGGGMYTAAIDRGVPGITVTLYDTNGTSISTVTDANGNYSLDAGSLTAGPYRLEFTGYEGQSLRSNPNTTNAQTGTSVQFVPDDGGTFDMAVNNAQDYCQDDPQVISQCYVFGDQTTDDPVLVSYPYGAGVEDSADYRLETDLSDNRQPTDHDIAIPSAQMGSTFGLGYDRQTGDVYSAAYMKRHSGYGPGGIGMIYRVEPDDDPITPDNAVQYFDMNTLPGNPAGTDFRAATGHDFLRDDGPPYDESADAGNIGLDAVGKISLGSMATDSFGRYLYVMALGNRTLYRLPIDPDTAPLTDTSEIISQQVPLGYCPGGAPNTRPFSVTTYDWEGSVRLYVGVTCTAESTGNAGDLRLLVYEVNADTLAFSSEPVFETTLDYPRGIVNDQPNQDAEWRAWSPTWNPIGGNFVVNPQPLLTTLSFDQGNMIISIRDRWGDQIGNYTLSEPGNTGTYYRGATAGDMLRACGNPTAGWTLESAGTCPDGTGSGLISSRPQGPGNSEYYAGDEYEPFFDDSGDVSGVSGGGDLDDPEGRHDEIGLGASTQIPGFPDVVATMFDPVYNSAGNSGFNSGGARWLNNQTGLVERSYTLYDASMTGGNPPGPGNTLGKANGLGDIVEFCDLPPLEIGNRVWLDTDRDGTQDPDEQSIGGVTVSLWEDADNDSQPDPGGFVVSTVTSGPAGLSAPTDDTGQYLFVENEQSNGLPGTAELPASYNNGSGQWKYGTNYVIRLDRREDYQDTALLAPYVITGQGLSDVQNDSDGVDTTGTAANPVPPGFSSLDGVQFAQTAFNVGFPGEHNHTYDFGFNEPAAATDTPTPTATFTPTATETPPPEATNTPGENTPAAPGTPGQSGTPGQPTTPDVNRPPAEQTRIALNGGTPPPGLETVEQLPATGEPRSRRGIYAALLAAGGLSVLMGAAGWWRGRRR